MRPNEAGPADGELIERFRRGDAAAFTLLVRRWEAPVHRIAWRITGDAAEAEDVRQTVFLRLLEDPWSLRDAARFGAWIRRCAVNAAINAAARRARIRGAGPDPSLDVRESEEDPAERAAAREEAERLSAALAGLPPAERALLALRFDEDLTFEEIAAVIGRPASTIKSRVGKAVGKLRRKLGVTREVCDDNGFSETGRSFSGA